MLTSISTFSLDAEHLAMWLLKYLISHSQSTLNQHVMYFPLELFSIYFCVESHSSPEQSTTKSTKITDSLILD
jgi:hypothetical protein